MIPVLLYDSCRVHLGIKAILVNLSLYIEVYPFFLSHLLLLLQKHAFNALTDVIKKACNSI